MDGCYLANWETGKRTGQCPVAREPRPGMVCNPPFRGSIKKVGAFSALGGGFLRWATSTMRRDELLAKMQDNECFNLVDYPLCFSVGQQG
jgi:hypothetical protein